MTGKPENAIRVHNMFDVAQLLAIRLPINKTFTAPFAGKSGL